MEHKLNFTFFALFIIVSIALAWLAFSFGGVDFKVYYAAARVMLHGGNPYDYEQLAPQIISSAGKLNNPYYYAPWFTWSVIPFAVFPYTIARILWAIAHFVLWIFSLINLSKLIDYPPSDWTKWGMWLLATFTFAWSTWGAEQVGILILFLFTMILLSASHENWLQTGIFLALILFKPNITAIPVGLISLWILIRKQTWKPILIMITTVAVLLTLSLIPNPKWYLALFDVDKFQGLSYTLNSSGGLEIKRYTTTLGDFLTVYGIKDGMFIAIYCIFIGLSIIAILFAMQSSASLVELSAFAILANFAIIPYALFYDYPSLALTWLYCNHLLFKNSTLKWIRYIANTMILAGLFVGEIIPYRYWITIILTIFLALGNSFKKTTS